MLPLRSRWQRRSTPPPRDLLRDHRLCVLSTARTRVHGPTPTPTSVPVPTPTPTFGGMPPTGLEKGTRFPRQERGRPPRYDAGAVILSNWQGLQSGWDSWLNCSERKWGYKRKV